MVSLARFAALLLALSGLAGQALAEHEADHRYTIRGYVLDGEHEPVANRNVTVYRDGRPVGASLTDRDGHYSVKLHLHDEDLGAGLQVRAGNQSGRITVAFEPGDQATERFHPLHLVGGQAIEGPLPGRSSPALPVPIIAALAVLAAAALVFFRRRRRRPAGETAGPAKPGSGSRKNRTS